MNLLKKPAQELIRSFQVPTNAAKTTEVWIAPPFSTLATALEETSTSAIKVGAQNCYSESHGAFTGEVSGEMLFDMGCYFTLIGHSERRSLFHEATEQSAERAVAALEAGLRVIFCVGETLEEREKGTTLEVVCDQLKPLLEKMDARARERLLVAYEPVWAIGTGKVASLEQIQETHAAIKQWLYKEHEWKDISILYGGSVKPENFEGIVALEAVDGALVGGASLKSESFLSLLEIAESV